MPVMWVFGLCCFRAILLHPHLPYHAICQQLCCPDLQGVKLYYNVLEAMLTAEENRTHRTNFTLLLASNSFHKCLAACAFELIVASYKMVRVLSLDMSSLAALKLVLSTIRLQ